MPASLFILGRQPAIGRAELERLYGADSLRRVGSQAMLCELSAEQLNFARLGGSIKMCTVLENIDSTEWRTLQTALIKAGLRLAESIPEGKIQLGLSVYELRLSTGQLTAGGLELKKALRRAGHSVRLVQNQELTLNSAQVLHNHLTGERGIELILVKSGAQTILAHTVAEQDITAYTVRDRGRPKRDARVGMLPPKLAQTIVNLAVGSDSPSPEFVVLDPFCGTGVVLQEALLMGLGAYGTDLEKRMADYSATNLSWLEKQYLQKFRTKLEVGDATTHQWSPPINAVASETYLGRPLTALPTSENLRQIVGTCNLIIEKFLKNIGAQLEPGTPLCLAMPAWQQTSGHFVHLPLLDHLSNLGYNRIDFRHARHSELIYHRPDQIVGRELVVITRK